MTGGAEEKAEVGRGGRHGGLLGRRRVRAGGAPGAGGGGRHPGARGCIDLRLRRVGATSHDAPARKPARHRVPNPTDPHARAARREGPRTRMHRASEVPPHQRTADPKGQ
ncbi:hypothetical protein GCM10010329_52790 [Streptomyces spiroverticillatus]|nr:hypothetical protein GCM10010329_52790 [Streptomyces spiroverticillatus]